MKKITWVLLLLTILLGKTAFAQGVTVPVGFNVQAQVPIDDRFVFADTAARNLLGSNKRFDGLNCYTRAEKKNWQLVGGIANSYWIEVSGAWIKNENRTHAISTDDSIAIGSLIPGAKLDVNGTIIARQLPVIAGAADTVIVEDPNTHIFSKMAKGVCPVLTESDPYWTNDSANYLSKQDTNSTVASRKWVDVNYFHRSDSNTATNPITLSYFNSNIGAATAWTKSGNKISATDDNDSIGIGKIPTTKLDVNGVIAATGGTSTDWNAKEPAIGVGTTAQYWRGDKSWQTTPVIAANTVTGTGISGYLPHFNGASTVDSANMYWGNGKFGVGTTAPSTTLEVSGVITATGGNSGAWNNAFSFWNNDFGFLDRSQSSVSFSAADSTLTLTKIGTVQYTRQGVLCTMATSQTKTITYVPGRKSGYYFYFDGTDGTLLVSTDAWTLCSGDTKVPVAYVQWNGYNTSPLGKYILYDERHSRTWPRALHYYAHSTIGTRYQSGGATSSTTILPGTASNANNQFAISGAEIDDEDISTTLSGKGKPVTNTSPWTKYHRTAAGAWAWDTLAVPYPYSATYIQYENPTTAAKVTAQNNRFVNSYVLFTNAKDSARFIIVPGRAEFTTAAAAQAEDPKAFDWTGFSIAEAVIMYRLTWSTGSGFTGALGRVKLNNEPMIVNQSISSTSVSVSSSGWSVSGSNVVNTTSGTVKITQAGSASNLFEVSNDINTVKDSSVIIYPNGQFNQLFTQDDYQGLAWNQDNDTYIRLGTLAGKALNATPGDDLMPVQRGMRGCVMNDDGTINYYLLPMDWNFKADFTASTLTGADGQVMVEIPRFYYKYENASQWHIWKISRYPLAGFSVHAAFTAEGANNAATYIGAYEGVLQDVSASIYANGLYLPACTTAFAIADSSITLTQYTNPFTSLAIGDKITVSGTTSNNTTYTVRTTGNQMIKVTESVVDEASNTTVISTQKDLTATTGDKLASVSGKAGITMLTRGNSRVISANRGAGWHQFGYDQANAIQLLCLIEYGSFYWQNIADIGPGITNVGNWPAYNNYNSFAKSGNANIVGNFSGDNAGASTASADIAKYSKYRGIENFYGHIWKWADGININNNRAYISSNYVSWSDNTATGYYDVGTNMSSSNGYQEKLINSSRAILPLAVGGLASGSARITDYYYQTSGWAGAVLGGYADYGSAAGGFYWALDIGSGAAAQHIGARLSFK